jgi:DNA repair exonuclease SbcCD ATPase subunit
MAQRITRLRIDEGSLVDEPANIGARVLLWKRHDPAADPVTDEDQAMATKNDDLSERVGELEDQIGDLTKANADLTEALKKAQQPTLPLQPPPGAAEAQLKKECSELQAKLKAAEDEIAKAKAPVPNPNVEDLTKGMSFEVREAFETLRKQSEQHETIIAKMRDEAELRDAITKVEKSWPALPVKPKDFGPVYRKITKALADDADGMAVLEKVLTSYGALADIAGSTVGRGGALLAAGDAWTEAETKAMQLRQKTPDLSADQAIAKVFEIEPDLYRRYKGELSDTTQ